MSLCQAASSVGKHYGGAALSSATHAMLQALCHARGLAFSKEKRGMVHTTRLTMVHFVVPLLLLVLMPIPVRGSDAKGNDVALGFGLEACQTFLQARSNGLDLPYRHWLTGYLTAVNTLTKDTVDMRGTTDIDGMLGLLEHYCIKHRDHSFSRAVEFLVTDLYPKRRTHMPQKHE